MILFKESYSLPSIRYKKIKAEGAIHEGYFSVKHRQ